MENLPVYTRTKNRARYRAIDAYGGKCACCGETNVLFLCLDHIVPRSKLVVKPTSRGDLIARELRKDNYKDPNIQVLCYNCNSAKNNNADCPCKKGTVSFTAKEGLEKLARKYKAPKLIEDAASIRQRFAAGERATDLAAEYSVHPGTMSRVINKRRHYTDC